MRTLKLLTSFAFLIVFSVYVQAQQAETTKKNKETVIILSGVVYDITGALVTKAKVSVKTTNNQTIQAITNEDGIFQLKLSPASYQIEFESPGFKIFKLENFKVVNSTYGKMNQDIVLEVRDCDDCEGIISEPIKEIRKPK
jgi:hypothetical protein